MTHDAFKVFSAPMKKLFQARIVFRFLRRTLANQRRVRRKDDALFDAIVRLARYFAILELIKGI